MFNELQKVCIHNISITEIDV